ncbi:hypothetical protein [Pseudorhodoplanes sp.]|jgi:hypothetical protein|uniref:hypothetical protein n=1 Tax=Pseudorhodoplanes sp. TaxID=1934341 RepID=UPI002BAADCCC|nr:hypothetical protein [Pseudorhodoplanes sp.]HWV42608.1 hypothetical protein [Pseudorhodoplanes sp.]
MSVLELDRLCRETLRDHAFRKAMQTDPEGAIARYRLTEEEKRALLAGDVVALHRMGVNDFLMGYLARFGICGLNIQNFSERIRSAGTAGGGH